MTCAHLFQALLKHLYIGLLCANQVAMESTWNVLSRHPVDEVVWRYLRLCDVHRLLCVNKTIRAYTRQAFASTCHAKTSVYFISEGDTEDMVHVSVTVMMHGAYNRCIALANVLCIHANNSPHTTLSFPCKWQADANPRYGKVLIGYVRRLLRIRNFDKIRFSFTSAVGWHHTAVAFQMQHVERRFHVNSRVAVPLFLDVQAAYIERLAAAWFLYRHKVHMVRLAATIRQRGTPSIGSYCIMCAAILEQPAYLNPTFVTTAWSQCMMQTVDKIAFPSVYRLSYEIFRQPVPCAYCGGQFYRGFPVE